MTNTIPPPFDHQTVTTRKLLENPDVIITSDPGTGKTRSVVDAHAERRGKKLLVFAPLSILQSSWGDDIDTFQPTMTYSIAYARNRQKAFEQDVDVVVTNHDAVKWVKENQDLLIDFDTIVVDEFTAFKNKDAKRSKAMYSIRERFKNHIIMSGTPNPNTVLDLWHPMMICDGGERLGRKFYSFRGKVCTPVFNGFANEWVDKPDAQQIVAAAIMDINVRFALEECIDMPEHNVYTIRVDLPASVMKAYKQLSAESTVELTAGRLTTIHAGAKVKKLLQICTGAVYNEDGEVIGVHDQRYDLVMELVQQREHSLVAFNWKHERDCLVKKAEELGISYAVIDGDTPVKERTNIVQKFQAGEIRVIFAHPQSAGHGLTLTRATATIWASPTYNSEHFQQFNRRIYRAGQKKRTETILIAARGTWEPAVYAKLNTKLSRMDDLLNILSQTTE